MSPNKTYLSVAKTNQTNNNDKDWTITLFNKLWLQFNTKMTTVYSASQSSKPSATRSSPSIPQSSTFTPSISASIFISSTDSQHISTIIPIPTVNITSNKTFNSTPNSTFNTNSPSSTITTTSTIDNDIYSITNPTPNHTFHLLNPTQLSNVTTKAIPTTNANIDANFKKSHLHDNVNASSTIKPTTDKAVSSTSFIHGQDNTNQINTAINSSTSSPILLCSNSLSPSTHEFLRSLHPPTSSLQNDPQDTSDTSDNNNIAAFPDAKIQKGNVNIIVQEIKSLISPFSQALPDQLSLQRHITEVDDFDDFVNYMTYLPTEPYITNLISQPTLNLSSLPIHNPHDTILLLDTLESEIIHESTFFHLYPNNSSTLNSSLHNLCQHHIVDFLPTLFSPTFPSFHFPIHHIDIFLTQVLTTQFQILSLTCPHSSHDSNYATVLKTCLYYKLFFFTFTSPHSSILIPHTYITSTYITFQSFHAFYEHTINKHLSQFDVE